MTLIPYNHFLELAKKYEEAIDKLVRATAFKVEREAKQHAPVDTGFLRNSIYTRTETDSGYAKSATAAGRHGGGAGQTLFAEVAQPAPRTAYVAVGAEYGMYVEFGTSRMPAKPYMLPAVEAVRPQFTEAMRRLVEKGEAEGIEIVF